MPSCMSPPAQARKVFGVWMSGAPDAKIRSPREACLAARCRLQANRYIRNYGSSENGSYPARRNLQKSELSWQCVVQNLHFSAKWRSIRPKCRKRGTISLFHSGIVSCDPLFSYTFRLRTYYLTSFFHRLPEFGHGGADSGLRCRSFGGVGGVHFVRVDIRPIGLALARHRTLSFS